MSEILLPWDRQPQEAVGCGDDGWQARGLVAWLPGNTLTAYDGSGYRRAVVASGLPAVVLDQFGRCIAWDRVDDQVSFGVIPHLPKFTLAAWVYLDTTVYNVEVYCSLISRGAVFEISSNFAFGIRPYASSDGTRRVFLYSRGGGGALAGSETPGVSVPDKAWSRLVGVYDGTTYSIYINGALAASATGGVGDDASHSLLFGAPSSFTSTDTRFPYRSFDMRVYSVAWRAEEARQDFRESKWSLFEPRRIQIAVPASAGGSTLTATLIDTAAGTDIASASAVLSATSVEAAAGIDLAATTAVRSVTLTEATAGTDLASSLSTLTASRTEPAAGAEITSAAPTFPVSLVEAAAGTDIRSALSTLAASLVDPAAGIDTINSGAVTSGTLLDGVSAADISSAVATLAATVSEGATALDVLLSTRIANVVATEAAAGVDIATTGTTFAASLVDAVVSADALASAAVMVAQLVEAGSVSDQIHAAQQLVVLLTEPAAGSDLVSSAAPAVYSVTLTELAAALDVLNAALGGLVLAPGRRRVQMPDATLMQRSVQMPAHSLLRRSVALYPA